MKTKTIVAKTKPDLDVKVRIAKYDGWRTVGQPELVEDFIEGHKVWEQRMETEDEKP